MSFDFDPQPVGGAASDPTADFLERERQALGALGGADDLISQAGAFSGAASNTADDFERSASNFPALDGADDAFSGPAASAPAPAQSVVGDLFGFDGEEDKQKSQFESQYPAFNDPDLDTPVPATEPAATSNGFSSQPSTMNPRANSNGGDDDDSGEDPAPIREWRSKQADEIAARNALAERKKGEAISRAEKETDTFYEEYNAKKEKTIAKNKENEAVFRAQREKDLAEGTTWQRVNKLLELQNAHSKTISKAPAGASDVSRMKEIYLNLAEEGENAPGAAGY
ncbi:hypothetical protein K437DRAFT_260039 [Tilletiaria anomala UBC 951]|uniref:Clathrin light chain n=1 Tax=Tilletiaria anomala (strain ATCC 24038 / CBS 436.72 / UBC 951) TaxID=1037660 RepID=A0A066V5E5_TILAU|nr:uncharacterized protein K437DRAFT_260039 [Tilletiaria anomala UBC 951]KDN36701.1 hypothetical protein K437DRAFT_260039 [Tilletiaria anomala UBC 951]